jgi:hypothetical protein
MTIQLKTTPYWIESAPLPHFGPLDQHEDDVPLVHVPGIRFEDQARRGSNAR